MSYTQSQIDTMINKSMQALADCMEECQNAREAGQHTLPYYLKGRYLSGAIKSFSSYETFTDTEIEKIMSCLGGYGVTKYPYSVVGSVVQTYNGEVPGSAGAQGLQGIQGQRGTFWRYGSAVPSALGTDAEGDLYIRTTNGAIYEYDGSAWNSAGFAVLGPTGRDGYDFAATSTTTYDLGGSATITCHPNVNDDTDGLSFQANDRILITDNTRANTYAVGIVSSYNSTTGAMVLDTADFETVVLSGVEQSLPATVGNTNDMTINLTGLRGLTGSTGSTGATGTRGGRWSAGSGAPTHVGTEINGDAYLDVANGNVYINDSTTWGSSLGSIRGPQGIQGIQGTAGADAVFSTQKTEHDTTAADYGFANSIEVIGTGLTPFTITWNGSSGGVLHIFFSATILATGTNTDVNIQVEVGGTAIDAMKQSIQITDNDDTRHPSMYTTYSGISNGDVVRVRGNYTAGGASMTQGTFVVWYENA